MNKSIALFNLFILLSSAVADSCFAPLGQWGPVCAASSAFNGYRGAYVNYHVFVKEAGAQVWCYGLGISAYTSGSQCSWRMIDLGMINNQYVSTVWDNANAAPSIQCYATGRSSNLDWTFTTGQGQYTCIKKSHKKLFGKVSVDEGAMVFSGKSN